MRRNQPEEATVDVLNGDAALVMLDRLPDDSLLIDARRQPRRVGIHDVGHVGVAGRRQQILDANDADQTVTLANGDMSGIDIRLLSHPGDNGIDVLPRAGHRMTGGIEAGGVSRRRHPGGTTIRPTTAMPTTTKASGPR
jgi:hypothetical protein